MLALALALALARFSTLSSIKLHSFATTRVRLATT
jgi:hypothetical protein